MVFDFEILKPWKRQKGGGQKALLDLVGKTTL